MKKKNKAHYLSDLLAKEKNKINIFCQKIIEVKKIS
jgi:hypothetical protein